MIHVIEERFDATVITSLGIVGIVVILAALCGGGLSALGFRFPPIQTFSRQLALGAFGLTIIILSFYVVRSEAPNKVVHISTANQARETKRNVSTTGDCSPAFGDSTATNVDIHC